MIVCLGWGSLIWNLGGLPVEKLRTRRYIPFFGALCRVSGRFGTDPRHPKEGRILAPSLQFTEWFQESSTVPYGGPTEDEYNEGMTAESWAIWDQIY